MESLPSSVIVQRPRGLPLPCLNRHHPTATYGKMPRRMHQKFFILTPSYQEYVKAIRHRGGDMGSSNSCGGNMRQRGHKEGKERTIFWTSAALWDSPLD